LGNFYAGQPSSVVICASGFPKKLQMLLIPTKCLFLKQRLLENNYKLETIIPLVSECDSGCFSNLGDFIGFKDFRTSAKISDLNCFLFSKSAFR
jgi:hypothetical protein